MRRAVIDTNVWVSALLNPAGPPARVLAAFETGKFIIVASEPLLAELQEVLRRPRMARKYHISKAIADEFISRIRRRAVLVPVTHTLRLCRHPSDDIVIETAALGQANALVTRDDDIKDDSELKGILSAADIQVLSVRHFLAELEFTVNYQELHPQGRRFVRYDPRHSTREQTYRGTI